MNRIKAGIAWVITYTGIDEAVLEALRVGLSTGLAVMLATGAPILDMTAADSVWWHRRPSPRRSK